MTDNDCHYATMAVYTSSVEKSMIPFKQINAYLTTHNAIHIRVICPIKTIQYPE